MFCALKCPLQNDPLGRLCCTNRVSGGFSLSRTGSSHGFGDKYAERDEAVQDGHTDLKLDNLTVEVPRHEGLTRQFNTMHLAFDAASTVIIAPSSPDGSVISPESKGLHTLNCLGKMNDEILNEDKQIH